MTDIDSDEYWSKEFTITSADLDRIHEQIQRDNKIVDVTSLVKQLVKRRLEFGHEISPTVLKLWTGKDSVRIWDPFVKWSVGDGIIVPHMMEDGSHECFVGEVVSVDKRKPHDIEIRLDGQNELAIYRYGNPEATDVHQFAINLAEKKYEKAEGVEGIVARFGNRIVSALLYALKSDERFVGLEGKWYLVHKLPGFEVEILKSMHPDLLKKPSFSLDDIMLMVKTEDGADKALLKMSIQTALLQLPERFENISALGRPQWKALPPKPEQAKVIYYVYDPSTYEILCSPEQHLPLEKAQRLMELNLYVFTTTFMDGV